MNIAINPKRRRRAKPQLGRLISDSRGNLLVYMVVVLLIFGVLGVSLVSLFTTSTGSTATSNDAKRALFIAESGIRYALSEIRNSPDVETAAELLNTTTEFKLGKDGVFTVDVFSPGLRSAQNKTIFGSGFTLRLDVPYGGKFPDDFDVHNAVNDVYIVDWLRFKGTTPPTDSVARIIDPPPSDVGGATDVTLTLDDDYDADLTDTICFALLVTDDETNIPRGRSIFVNEKAAEFFPSEDGAIRIVTLSDGEQYDYYYEKREPPGAGKVELKNVREMPGDVWTNIADLRTGDYVILSPFNFRVFASGTSEETTVNIGYNRPFWALARPDEYTIYMRELLEEKSPVQEGDVIRTQEAGDKKIELGRGTSGTEGFGDLWYGGDKSVGGNANYCKEGRCLFDLGVRVFFTSDVIPGASGGQGFTFALIAGGDLFSPVNTRISAGGDFQLPELLAYGGNSQVDNTPAYLDTTGDGLKPPKMAVEFDTDTNFDPVFNSTLAYCSGSDPVPDSRNDPRPENQDRDVVQYVFWGNNDPADFNLPCRVAAQSYDDNRHDAEGKEASLNFAFSAGAPVRSEPAYDPTDGTVYFGSDDAASDFWAINSEDGSLKWSYNPGSTSVTSKPALDTIGSDRFVYFSASNNRIYKLRTDSGVKVWDIPVGGSISDKVSPAVNNNNHNIYIGSLNDNFYAYDADGNLSWSRDVGEDIQATATIDQTNGNAYVGTDDENSGTNEGQVVAFDTESATPNIPLWTFKTDNDVQSQPAINADGTVVYGVTDIGLVYAIPAAGGAAIWTRDLPDVNFLDPAVWVSGAAADGTVYVPTDGGELYALNPANGNNRTGWPIALVGAITFSSPAVGPDGTVYIGTDGNRVYAINPDGTIKWEFPTPTGDDVRSSPEIGDDGVVYVGANDGNLYAIANVALPRNYRNTYLTGQRGYLTAANLDSNVVVDDTDNWLDGSPLTKGPWAVRTEVKRAISPNPKGNYEYTLLTWIRQCVESDCSDIKGTPFQDTTGEYTYSPGHAPDLPFEQIIELTPADHGKFERFLFGFTTAAGASDTQLVEIRDFQLTFSRSGDPTLSADPTWIP